MRRLTKSLITLFKACREVGVQQNIKICVTSFMYDFLQAQEKYQLIGTFTTYNRPGFLSIHK